MKTAWNRKPLTPEEMPSTNMRIIHHGHTKRGTNWLVEVECPHCHKLRWVAECNLRYRKPETTLCRSCAYIYKPKHFLVPEEIQGRDNIVVDFDKQEYQLLNRKHNKRMLCIWATCPDCKLSRWITVNGLRSNNQSTLCPKCAAVRGASKRTGPNSSSWKGGKQTANGYIMIHRSIVPEEIRDLAEQCLSQYKRTYYYEHQVVALQKYGAYSPKEFLVRHLNGDKTDNRPENLVLGNAVENRMDHVTAYRQMLAWRNFALWLLSVWIPTNPVPRKSTAEGTRAASYE